MSDATRLGFSGFAAPARGALVVFCDDKLTIGAATKRLLGRAAELVKRAAAADKFTGKPGSALELIAPAGLKVSRLIVLGVGKPNEMKAPSVVRKM